MYGIGTVVYGLGGTQTTFIVSARVFSALLGGVGVVLVYFMTRFLGASVATSALAGLFCIASGVIPANSRLAHNDIYLMFFSILCMFFSIRYQFTKLRIWIYAAFLAVGMAASSKYTGGSLILLPVFVLIILNWADIGKDWLKSMEVLFIGGVLAILGYGLGTPKSLLWMAYYFKRVFPALEKLSVYNFNSGTPIGLFGQWDAFWDTVGGFLFLVFLAAVLWFIYLLIRFRFVGNALMREEHQKSIAILLAGLVFFDMPFLTAVHYLPRHFIPFIPYLSVLAALFVAEIYRHTTVKSPRLGTTIVTAVLFLGISYSFLKLVSIALLHLNDARMPASEYIAHLPGAGKTIEYTLYPPIVNKPQFEKARNYPIYFVKYPGEVVPTGGRFELNQGEQGLLDREVDYLVIDTFTYSRLYTDTICETNPVECDFFKRLLAGEVTTFRLVGEFAYTLPPWLPQVTVNAVNPEIRIYERIP
jgi:4-amino-4-deoxy-L-arabinose transferase-like glycosyltransferase